MPGSVVLVGGEPGIGKSTLLLQAAAGVARSGSVLYASGEESAAQVRLRATRLGLVDGAAGERVRVVAEASIDRIVDLALAERPSLLIVDSIQTATVDDLDGRGRQRGPGPRVDPAPDGAGQERRPGRRGGSRANRTGTTGRSPWSSSAM